MRPSSRPVHRGRLRRRARVGTGCGVLRAGSLPRPREAPGDTALPPLRAERANALREAQERRPAVLESFAESGRMPINRRRGAPRGERPRMRRLRKLVCEGARGVSRKARSRASSTRYAPAGLRHWPAKGASQAPGRLSALHSLTLVRGNSKARGAFGLARTMMHAIRRERRCSDVRASFTFASMQRVLAVISKLLKSRETREASSLD